jgi:hypothetical protein
MQHGNIAHLVVKDGVRRLRLSRSAVDHPAKAAMALAVLVNVHRLPTVFGWFFKLRWVVPIVIHGLEPQV